MTAATTETWSEGKAHRHQNGAHTEYAAKANGVAERLVGAFRRECLDHIIIVNDRHLRHLLGEFV